VPDLVLARLRVVRKQAGGREDHARRAVAALQGVVLVERLLDWMEIAVVGKPFDRGHLKPVRLNPEHGAGLHRLAVHEHGAGAARGRVAADIRPGQSETVAQHVDEELTRLQVELVASAVDSKRDASHSCLLVGDAVAASLLLARRARH
jgi:hypothetical protein